MILDIDQELALEHARSLAKDMFPAEWRATLGLSGEKRRRRQKALRERAEHEVKLRPLREAGKTCADCAHYEKAPFGIGFSRICGWQSDSDGYVQARADGLCAAWAIRS